MLVTKATPEDIPNLKRLINAAYRGEESKKGWTTEADILDGIRIDDHTLVEYFNRSDVSILKYCNEFDEIYGTVYLEFKLPKLYLGMLAVSPISQGNGIGKLLLMQAEQLALDHECNSIAISVISTRTELIACYMRHGYVKTGKSIAFEALDKRFGDPKVSNIKLIGMEKYL